MQLQEIRNQMWVITNGEPLRKAKENEIKRWAVIRIIETLQMEKTAVRMAPQPA